MPPAPQPHRTWGTRYDSLVDAVTAPSSSPPNANNNHSFRPSNQENSIINTSGSRTIPAATNPPSFPLHNDAVKERSHMQPQHQDEKYSERLPNTNSNQERYPYHNYPAQHSPTGVHARMPHDASVFVASLPSHLADPELQILLTEHLSHHATIKHVKLIRDNRNAVCAFVQVQSATQATELIDRCNLSLFMDRQIRCERARAFRTLLASWVKQEELDHTSSARRVPSPQPLRLRRCRGSRFVQITLGADAFCADPQQLANCSLPRADDPLCGAGVFFESGIVEGDVESLKRLMEAFGPLEFIMPFDPKIHQTAADNELESDMVNDIGGAGNDHDDTSKNPVKIEHENIDGMWAVKWEHRNDAVSAVTALQAIGNLCVRWCHTYGQTTSSSTGLSADTGYSSNPSTPHRPAHHSNPTTPHRPRVFGHGNQWYHGNGYQHKQDQYHNHSYPLNHDQNSAPGRFNHGNSSGVSGPAVHRSAKLPLSFSESDFPPLNGNPNLPGNSTEHNVNDNTSELGAGTHLGYSSDETPRRRDTENSTVWDGTNSLTFSRSNAPSPSPIHESQSLLPSLWLPLETTPNTSTVSDANNNMSDKTDSSEGEVIPCTPETPDLEPEIEGADGSASGVDTPLTPGFPQTPHTPRSAYISRLPFCNDKLGAQSGMEHGKANGHVPKTGLQDSVARSNGGFLINHTSSHIRTNFTPKVNVSLITKHSHQHHPSHGKLSHDQERDGEEYAMVSPNDSPTNPMSAFDRELFIGGLGVDSWSEERVRGVFSQYGPIEELRFVKPYHGAPVHRRGFAFVRYVHCEDAQKAIHGQHMRLYDDHKIKVQLRDTHPNSRRSQWNYRGRTRYNQGSGHSNHDENRGDDVKQNSPSPSPGRASSDGSPDEKRVVATDEVTPKYPCITDPLSEEEEAALRHDFIHDKDRGVSHKSSPNTRSFDGKLSSTSPFTSPPRADSDRRTTQSESGLRSPPPANNTDALSTYAPSSTESAPPSSTYYAYPGIANAWVPPYALYAPSSHDHSHPGTNTTIPSAQTVPSDPWMGIYKNMFPAVPWFNPPPGVELTTAPLHPTGYIQRDGIFIPVYPPERLGQYMSTTSNGTDNGSGDEQQARTTSPPTTASPTTATAPANSTTPATSTPPWAMTGTHPPQPYAYPMPYAVPPHAMMLPPHMAHYNYQAQWMSSPPYPHTVTQPHGYANGQQSQPHPQPQQHVPYVPVAVNGYPLHCQHPQQSHMNGQPPAYYPRNSFPVYDSISNVQPVQGQAPVVGQPGGGAQPQVQPNHGQGKPGNGNRRDFGHHYRGNVAGANGRPGRRGASNGGSGNTNSTNGNGQSQANSTSPRTARVPINALPLQVTTA